MKHGLSFALAIAFWGLTAFPAFGAFSSIYVFGDSISCTASNTTGFACYYGKRYSNGRVWVEDLAQMQGLAFNPTSNTNSFFGNYSTNVIKQLNSYAPPGDAATALVILWVNNADLFDPALNPGTTLSQWSDIINQSQTNHFRIITNLYGKGFRTIIAPNVVDLSTVPNFNTTSGGYTNTVHQQCIAYNSAYNATLGRLMTNSSYPSLKIYVPDFFSLLADLLAHPDHYGATNALKGGLSIDAVTYFNNLSLPISTGPGTNFIFWDPTDPSAKVHAIMASVAQQMISPVAISQIAANAGSNQLDIVNVPVYTNVPMNGLVLACTNLAAGSWRTNLTFSTTNPVQSVWVTNTGPQTFYRLKFPYVWAWP